MTGRDRACVGWAVPVEHARMWMQQLAGAVFFGATSRGPAGGPIQTRPGPRASAAELPDPGTRTSPDLTPALFSAGRDCPLPGLADRLKAISVFRTRSVHRDVSSLLRV